MIVTYVMVAVCVVGVLGGIATVLSYDNLPSGSGSRMRIPRHSRRSRRASRPSRQLRAVESALAQEAATEQPASSRRRRARRIPLREHRRRG
jgi:hypothetical protein